MGKPDYVLGHRIHHMDVTLHLKGAYYDNLGPHGVQPTGKSILLFLSFEPFPLKLEVGGITT